MKIGTRLRRARLEADLSLEQVSAFTGIRRDVLIDIEADITSAQIGTIEKVAQLYRADPCQLMQSAGAITYREAMHALHLGDNTPFRRWMMGRN